MVLQVPVGTLHILIYNISNMSKISLKQKEVGGNHPLFFLQSQNVMYPRRANMKIMKKSRCMYWHLKDVKMLLWLIHKAE